MMATEDLHHTATTFMDHLPILAVLIPFFTAPVLVLIGNRGLAWPLALIASALSLLVSFLLLLEVMDGDIISYHLGGWAPPLGIEYRIDAANAFVMFLISGMATLILPFARDSVRAEIEERHHVLFYTLFLTCFTGLMGVVATGDAFNVFVFLEISSLSTYALIAMGAGRDKRALTAAFNYLIMGTIGATFFVIGIGLLYQMTGTLNMADLADRIGDQSDSRTIRAAFAFIVVGIGLKVAIYPLHLWLPNAYVYAPSVVSAFLAATATKAAIYVLLRFTFSVFEPDFIFGVNTLEWIILPFAILAMFAASFIAIFQNDLKRMLAYSSIAQIGYMLLGIAFLSETGLAAAIVHLFNHGLTKAALFMGVGVFAVAAGGSFYKQLEGMGKRLPWTSFAMVIAGISLIGVPGTAGFVSKWLLIEAALEKGWWPVAILIVASSLLAVIYVWRLVEVLYMRPAAAEVQPVSKTMVATTFVAAALCVWFGLATGITVDAAHQAANGLLAGSAGMR